MSKLQQLINQLCPNGVEFKPLGEICIMQRGTSLTKSKAKEGKYPVISGGKYPAFFCDTSNRKGETITVAGSGAGAGFVQYWNEPIFVCDSFSIKGTEKILTKYIYYFLTNIQENIYATKKGGGVPHVHISSIDKFQIPIPPLEVQEEIVRILDKFENYQAELQAELQARRLQYEYYRNLLLNFGTASSGGAADDEQKTNIITPPNTKIQWKTMGEIGPICMCKRVLKNQTNSVGGVPFYKIGSFGKVADSYISQELYKDYKKRFSFPQKGEILISASGTIGRTVVYNGEDAYFQDSNIVWIQNDESLVLNKFLFHYYHIAKWNTQGGTIKRLYNNALANTPIPIPPLEVQQKIVDILDRFEKLVSDLSEGLPAEIKAVKEQYEYYRNKLLSFKNIAS